MDYVVKCQHWGDKQYFEGDKREVKVKTDAEHLIGMGLLIDPNAAKADAEAAEQAKIDAKAQAEADAKAVSDAEKSKQEADVKAKADEEKSAPKPKNKMAKEVANKAE